MYSPDEFGVFALFVSLASLLGVLATGRYELAIVLPDKDEEAINVVGLSLTITVLISLVTLGLVWGFEEPVLLALQNPDLGHQGPCRYGPC